LCLANSINPQALCVHTSCSGSVYSTLSRGFGAARQSRVPNNPSQTHLQRGELCCGVGVLFRPFSFAPQITHLQLLYRFIAHSPRTTDQARTTPSNNSSRALRQLPSRHHSPIPSHHPFIKLPRACVCSSRIQHHLPFTIRHILTRCQLQSCHHSQTPWPFERIRTHHAFNNTPYHSPPTRYHSQIPSQVNLKATCVRARRVG
jgi:hypothetical protein